MSGTDLAYGATIRLRRISSTQRPITCTRGAQRCPIALHPEIEYKKPHFQYNLYQGCGFLHSISNCTRLPVCDAWYSRSVGCYAMPGTHVA
eukprot:1787392-Rhodomonas_salina.1